jgi:two-component system, OmpR family, osmolarity sensor histidine kinase EnvZ
MMRWSQSLFGRTALLIAGALLLFSIIAWQARVWTVVVPAAQATAHVLTERARAALAARRAGQPLPPDTRFEQSDPPQTTLRFHGFAYGHYVDAIRKDLSSFLDSPDVRIGRMAAPLELWIRVPDDVQGRWLVMSWRPGGPQAPLAALGVLVAGALIVLVAAGVSARRLTAPLAGLAAAAARLGDGEAVDIATNSGPSEVRSLAIAFQSMAHRLVELDEQRELMLGGISHDLRTPLARIRVAIELVDTQDQALRDEMAASVEEMDRMIGQFLNYVRANYREGAAAASLDDVVRETLAVNGRDGQVELELDAGECRHFAVGCIRHTVLNLVQNALEYGRPPVSLRTASTGQEIELQVTDHGTGLTSGEWLEALKPFHRLRTQPGGAHSGLGLALVDRLVRTSGGSLESERHDGVFTVTVRLPASSG